MTAATGPRKKLPFATTEQLLSVLQRAEAAHDEAVSDYEDTTEDSLHKQLLPEFAPAIRKVYSLWRKLAGLRPSNHLGVLLPMRAPKMTLFVFAWRAGEKSDIERELLLEFLPAYAEASLALEGPQSERCRAGDLNGTACK